MKPYGRRHVSPAHLHGAWCTVCYSDDVNKARERRAARREAVDNAEAALSVRVERSEGAGRGSYGWGTVEA